MRGATRLLLVTGMFPLLASGADRDGCAAIAADGERLACYDRAAANARPSAESSYLDKLWELERHSKRGTFRFREHKPVYILPLHYSNNPNRAPASPAPDHSVTTPMVMNGTSVKYQLSFKTKLWEEVIGRHGDLWFGYTQQSHWLLYNPGVSSPFRETNYEPELIFSLRTNVELWGVEWRMLNLGLSHQSNGLDLPRSRSWNRIYAQFGLERGDYLLMLRPWVRLPESVEDDDNPDIHRYMGHGDLIYHYRYGERLFSVLARYSASSHRGALQLGWDFPIAHGLKGYAQIFSGYGESLIDYNHKQTSIGFGVSMREWR